jgi:hypothetical protein
MSASLQDKLDRTAKLVEPVFHKILDEIDKEDDSDIYTVKATDYNGWANRSTWNVALWINNDEFVYKRAVSFMEHYENQKNPYRSFIITNGMGLDKTTDGIKLISKSLDYKALDEMMRELING